MVRSAEDYRWFFQAYFVMLLILLPFAFFEMMTGRPLLSELFSMITRVTPRTPEVRNSVFRAGVSYPHPIHWGLVASLMFAQAWLIWRDDTKARNLRAGVAMACTVTAMSSAPLLGLATQIGLIIWGRVTGNRWMLLVTMFATVFFALELLSNRGPVILFIETMTLDSETAWWRVYIWQYGSLSVMNHPVFGIGLEDWERPEWLAGTVDNFWLLTAMRYGLPAIIFLVLGLAWTVWKIARMRDLSTADKKAREGYLIGFVALCFALSTVHAWGAPSVLVTFYFGMGAFLFTGGARAAQESDAKGPADPAGPRRHLPYSRFPRLDRPAAESKPLPSQGRAGKAGQGFSRPQATRSR